MRKAADHTMRKLAVIAVFAVLLVLTAVPVLAEKHSTKYNGVNYKRVYDYEYYTTNVHPELAGKSDKKVLKYYIKNGIPNAEQAIDSFSVKSYRNANRDLRAEFGMDYRSYVMHYIKKGYKEGRTTLGYDDKIADPVTTYDGASYDKVYDFEYYVQHNTYVRKKYALDDFGAIQYFVKKGMKKKHQACENFNVVWYYNSYPELRYICEQTWTRYYKFYQRKGYKKGPVKPCPELEKPITKYKYGKKVYDLSKIYDFEYFTKHNSKAYKFWKKQNDAGAIKFFVKTGLLAGMRGNAKYSSNSKTYKKIKKKLLPIFMKDSEISVAYGLKSKTDYLILVNQDKHMVYLFKGAQYEWKKFMEFPCCVGAPGTPTDVGTFEIFGKGKWFPTNGNRCWYFTMIHGNQWFHSEIYDDSDSPVHLVDGTMGASVSHGCIRLQLSNAKWIYENIPLKTKVKIYNRPWN